MCRQAEHAMHLGLTSPLTEAQAASDGDDKAPKNVFEYREKIFVSVDYLSKPPICSKKAFPCLSATGPLSSGLVKERSS